MEHAPRLLVAHGQVLDDELRRCGLPRSDLHSMLRQRGVGDLCEVRFVVPEQRGQVSVIRHAGREGAEAELVRALVPRPS